MDPMRSIFIPKHPLPPIIDFLLRRFILACRCRKSRKNWGTASFLLTANPLAAPWFTANSAEWEKEEGWSAEPSVMSSEVGGARMREERREPNRECNTWGDRLIMKIRVSTDDDDDGDVSTDLFVVSLGWRSRFHSDGEEEKEEKHKRWEAGRRSHLCLRRNKRHKWD